MGGGGWSSMNHPSPRSPFQPYVFVQTTWPFIRVKDIAYLPTVPIFDFQNLQKSGRSYFQEFQTVNIPVL